VDVVQRSFHFVNDVIQVVDHVLGFSDELVDLRRLPLVLDDSGLDFLVHQVNSLFDQGFFDVVEASHDSVVVLDDQLQ